ncbi:hypothetical protein WR25_09983 [Diploscapter pachys]|uniref:BZIP domain-containing protein n=1 Tax=Diploscapter pachys TaxID=2018661 RepID=A0A2A2KF24_9BILA|nr:hypothetical protein WR25_09983 [Diploscapter pachys]
MFGNSNESVRSDSDPSPSPFKAMRPMGVRWRDDERMYQYLNSEAQQQQQHVSMPILVEQRSRSLNRLPTTSTSVSSNSPTSSTDGLTLEDMDLIDVLWRNDIATEKGARQLTPMEQYERDLQMLTEKSIYMPLSDEESARYEDLSKAFFEDFYAPNTFKDKAMRAKEMDEESEQSTRNTSTPTDEDLVALLDDVVKEHGQLDQVAESMVESSHAAQAQPLVNNVSLAQAVVYTSSNLTEMQYLQEERESITQATEQPPPPYSLYNDTSVDHTWAGADVYSSSGNNNSYTPFAPLAPLHGVEAQEQQPHQQNYVPASNDYDHNYPVQTSLYDSPYYPNADDRHMSFSGSHTDTSSVCSNTSDRSPGFSDMENRSPAANSRFYGKLVPDDRDSHVPSSGSARPAISHHSASSSFSSTSPPIPLQSQPRRRGRQSKDEQLAAEHNLPVTAEQIASMSLAELQKVLKNEGLSEAQKTLVRKIRRRGKNKVAARTCRQRRGDRTEEKKPNKWDVGTPVYKYESD